MRNFIDSVIITENWEHPHATGEDEWFRLFYRYWINVDQAKRMIASGEITPKRVSYPVKTVVTTLFGMESDDFGSKNFDDDETHLLMSGPPVTRSRMPSIPQEKMDEPLFFVMFNADQAEAILKKKPLPEGSKEFPILADGNHRIVRRFLDGDTGNVECDFIMWPDVQKVCYDAGNMKTPLISRIKGKKNA